VAYVLLHVAKVWAGSLAVLGACNQVFAPGHHQTSSRPWSDAHSQQKESWKERNSPAETRIIAQTVTHVLYIKTKMSFCLWTIGTLCCLGFVDSVILVFFNLKKRKRLILQTIARTLLEHLSRNA